MTTEINVYYFEYNCIFIRISLLQNFFSPPSISIPCLILRVTLSIKLCISLRPVLFQYDATSLFFLIDLILNTFSNILNRIQVRTIARSFQYGHIFTPEPQFVRFAACFRSFNQIYAI